MRVFSYIWHMAFRRKSACLLVIASAMVTTIFMLSYPRLIEDTRKKLDETYEGITITGSIVQTGIDDVGAVSGEVWKKMQASGYFSQMYAASKFSVRTFPKKILEAQFGSTPSEQRKDSIFQTMLSRFEKKNSGGVNGPMRAYNTFPAGNDLVRIRNDICWLDGYDEHCLEGRERICIISENWGYAPGDTVPFLARVTIKEKSVEGIFHLKVVGTYPGKITEFSGVMPLKTMEDLTIAATAAHKAEENYYEWEFGLDQIYFTIKDNRTLDEIKTKMEDWGLLNSDFRRVRLDDRFFKEAVGPIESNLAQLEGSYLFFFFLIAAIGFFISFLLIRNRKSEYAVMRLLGESKGQIILKVLAEQFTLCLTGVLFGILVIRLIDTNSFHPSICIVILMCYTFGAAGAALLMTGVNVMEILRDKE